MEILNNEVTDSLKESIKRRLLSPLYGIFIISWALFHWEFLYTALFTDQDKIWQATGLLKNVYLEVTFFNFTDWKFYFAWVAPFVLTYLIIWEFPQWISIPAFKKDLRDSTEKRRLEIIAQKDLETAKVAELNVASMRVKKEKEVKKVEQEVQKIDPVSGWEQEYVKFAAMPFYKDFESIRNSIYRWGSKISIQNQYQFGVFDFQIPENILAYAHTNDLVSLDKSKETIDLTDKGKFFMKKFTEDNSL